MYLNLSGLNSIFISNTGKIPLKPDEILTNLNRYCKTKNETGIIGTLILYDNETGKTNYKTGTRLKILNNTIYLGNIKIKHKNLVILYILNLLKYG